MNIIFALAVLFIAGVLYWEHREAKKTHQKSARETQLEHALPILTNALSAIAHGKGVGGPRPREIATTALQSVYAVLSIPDQENQ